MMKRTASPNRAQLRKTIQGLPDVQYQRDVTLHADEVLWLLDAADERDRLAVQLAEAEAGAAAMRALAEHLCATLEKFHRQMNRDHKLGSNVVYVTLKSAKAALAIDAGKRLLDVVRGLPEWVLTTAHEDGDAWEAAGFPHTGAMSRGTFAAKLADALREHLRAAVLALMAESAGG